MTNEQAINVLNMIETHGSLPTKAKEMAIKALEERPKGKWITDSNYPDTIICNKCNSKYDVWWIDKGSNYCPNCGAEMEVE